MTQDIYPVKLAEGTDPIAFCYSHALNAPRKVWPYLMEALVRGGSKPSEVYERFGATDGERAEVERLLGLPDVFGEDNG